MFLLPITLFFLIFTCLALSLPQSESTVSSAPSAGTAVINTKSTAPVVHPPVNEADRNKYFHEPGNHQAGEDDRIGHYDIRYYHGLVSWDERAHTLSHMTKAYLKTFDALGLETWIAHGTLLGWWWNGQILPWDWDVDTQVSGATLAHMARNHNRTTHEYLSEDKKYRRKYLLDVNPWSRERHNGDGANIIDARWIDMTNGLYIDITGLSELHPDQKPGVWSCKNFHDYHVRDLFPLRESTFEGMPALVPYAYKQMLEEEYNPQALVNITHQGSVTPSTAKSPKLTATDTDGMKTRANGSQ